MKRSIDQPDVLCQDVRPERSGTLAQALQFVQLPRSRVFQAVPLDIAEQRCICAEQIHHRVLSQGKVRLDVPLQLLVLKPDGYRGACLPGRCDVAVLF